MDYTPIKQLLQKSADSKSAKIRGWVHRSRSSGGVAFIVVRDASGTIQCAAKKQNLDEKSFADAAKALNESAVEAEGTVHEDQRAPGGFELQVSSFAVTHFADPFPIARDKSTEFLLDIRHLWLRSREITAAMKVKASVLAAARAYFAQEGYYETTPPIIVSGACEGGSTLFDFNYFGKKAYLSQSAQLYLEALIFSLEKVYAITPSFRAEKSRTVRHLAEYWHIEMEAAYVDFEGLLKFEEEFLSYICQHVAKACPDELKLLGRDPADLLAIKPPFKRMRYAEALEALKKKGVDLPHGHDFGAEDEKVLTLEEKKPIFITHFPKSIKAFYMKVDPENPDLVFGGDCLAPEGFGEIIGGSERETDAKEIEKRLAEQGQDASAYAWYLDLRKYGSVPHSGFGLGTERLVRWMCKLEHIRDATPFPRVINRSYP